MTPEMNNYLMSDLQSKIDTMLVGRVLYQYFASFWPGVFQDPSSPEDLIKFARWMEDTQKIVFSKTLSTVEWKNSSLAKGDLKEVVTELKQQEGRDMVIFGGAGIVSAFTSLGLVDEYRLKLEPVVLGIGRPLFNNIKKRMNLKLIKSKPFKSGVVGIHYDVIK
ncbi:MAG: dihydrofolate reductase family protein [Daejeonella sp.]